MDWIGLDWIGLGWIKGAPGKRWVLGREGFTPGNHPCFANFRTESREAVYRSVGGPKEWESAPKT